MVPEMNRWYLFRGKSVKDGRWIEGSLITRMFFKKSGFPRAHILPSDMVYSSWEDIARQMDDYEVDPGTVCAFTEMHDKAGRKIFEKDIVKLTNKDGARGLATISAFYHGAYRFSGKDCGSGLCYDAYDFEKVGNIFDDYEMLE